MVFLQRANENAAFLLVQPTLQVARQGFGRKGCGKSGGIRRWGRCKGGGQGRDAGYRAVHMQFVAVAECNRSVQQVFQFAHVAGQWMGCDGLHHGIGQLGCSRPRFMGDACQQGAAQRGKVFAALAQRGNHHLDDVEAVVEILPETPRLHVGRQVAVGGAHDAHIHRLFLRGAERAYAALLDRAQQFGLHGQRQVANFIKKQGAALCGLKIACAVLGGAGVGAFARAKELGFQQRFGDRTAVDSNQRPGGALAVFMQGACHQLFAGTRLATHQHRRHAARHLGHALLDVAHGFGLAHQAIQCSAADAAG